MAPRASLSRPTWEDERLTPLRLRFGRALAVLPVLTLGCATGSSQGGTATDGAVQIATLPDSSAERAPPDNSEEQRALPGRDPHSGREWQPDETGAGCTIERDVPDGYAVEEYPGCPVQFYAAEPSGEGSSMYQPPPPVQGDYDYLSFDPELTEQARQAGMTLACCYRAAHYMGPVYGRTLRGAGGEALVLAGGRGSAARCLEEHASAATFARLALELLGHGAPLELVCAAQRAARDELRHARALADLEELTWTPPALPTGGLLDAAPRCVSLLVREALLDGALGEAHAALQLAATAGAEAADSPLGRVASEELEHAELAWRVLAWLVRSHPERERARRELRGLLATLKPADATPAQGPASASTDDDPLLRGLLQQVVLPLGHALLELAHADDQRAASSRAAQLAPGAALLLARGASRAHSTT